MQGRMLFTVSILIVGACVVHCDPLYRDNLSLAKTKLGDKDLETEDLELRESKKCKYRGKNYSEGETIYRPAKVADILKAACDECTCLDGKFGKCSTVFRCEVASLPCNRYTTPTGECCPICKPIKCAKMRKVGDKWERIKKPAGVSQGICSQCECIEGRKESCSDSDYSCLTPNGCEKMVKVKDKCCPVCKKSDGEKPQQLQPTFPLWVMDNNKDERSEDY